MTTVTQSLLPEQLYIVGEYHGAQYRSSNVMVICPPAERLVTLIDSGNWIHADDCEGEDWGGGDEGESCDGHWGDSDSGISWMLQIPWTVFQVDITVSGRYIYSRPSHVYGCVEPPTIRPHDTELFRLPLPNVYVSGSICIGNAGLVPRVDSSLSELIAHGINVFWDSPYNRDLSNPDEVEDELTLWEQDHVSYLEKYKNMDKGDQDSTASTLYEQCIKNSIAPLGYRPLFDGNLLIKNAKSVIGKNFNVKETFDA